MKCFQCDKEINVGIKEKPSRHFMSPNSATFDLDFCSKKCAELYQKINYAWLADFDRNASDSECFEGQGWDGDYRIGFCKITGVKVRVIPLYPFGRSGQPEECTEHFSLRTRYKKYLV